MRATLLAPVLAVLASCSYAPTSAACARPGVAPCASLADVEVVDRSTGERLPIYWHEGQRWIAGTPGHRYSLTLRNRTGARIMTVVSVDGVNAVSGATADWNQGGYVLGSWQSFDVLGWRKSQDDVADFVFTSVADSYASRTGRPDNVGVIGVAIFSEAVPVPPVALSRRDEFNGPAAAGAAARSEAVPAAPATEDAPARAQSPQMQKAAPQDRLAQRQVLGTGHGQIETSVVVETNFQPAQPGPEQLITIRYDRRERLVALGILPPPVSYRPLPQAFPAAASAGFVADPPLYPPYGIR